MNILLGEQSKKKCPKWGKKPKGGGGGHRQNQNSLHFKFFPISVEGGVTENHFFPKFKKVQIILGGGGSRKFWIFSTIWDIFFLLLPLLMNTKTKPKNLILTTLIFR